MSESGELEYLVLNLLDQSEDPVGSGAVCEWLRHQGHPISEATAGRLLRELDYKGLTMRTGYRGRSLTGEGQHRLVDLRRERATAATSSELVNALRASGADDLVDVLVARRALEREIARLAAIKATDPDLEAMEILVKRYETHESATAAADADFAFHQRMAEVAGNRVLMAATRLIHAEAEAVPIPESIQRRIRSVLAQQHREILNALMAHDPVRAEKAMVTHLDGLIESIRRHWK